jgi:hypothetical protein
MDMDVAFSTPNCPNVKTRKLSLTPQPAIEIGRVVIKTIIGIKIRNITVGISTENG